MDLFEHQEKEELTSIKKKIEAMELELSKMKFKTANELVNGNYFQAKKGFNDILILINQLHNIKK